MGRRRRDLRADRLVGGRRLGGAEGSFGAAPVAQSRRELALAGAALLASPLAFGLVYGLTARQSGFSLADAFVTSVVVLAGASQFAAAGLVAAGAPWPAIVLLTAFLNARHLLYGAALAPWAAERPRVERALAAHVLSDEVFALAVAHFRRVGRWDPGGYWLAAAFIALPWPAATAVGWLLAERIPDPRPLGLDVVFPAAMAALAVALISGRRELVAAIAGVISAVVIGLVSQPPVGVVAGGLVGPLVGMFVPARGSASQTRAEARGP